MSGGLYQKPGVASSEFRIAQAYGVAGLACLISGFIAGAFDWPGKLAGLLVIVCAPLVALVPTVAYVLSRGKVKAAAESNHPPRSRVC